MGMSLYLHVLFTLMGFFSLVLCGTRLMLFFSNGIVVQETFGNHKTTGSLFCCL